ncbi:hypothetical protein RvY_05044 [Ramazzottius varieornatus]|uniref:Uncharacterized protein n=1 Tax=Ramazzottius varieornatus TaxID=947166 RepID=A0A1D1V2T5_RAMVA|nr:hypothetical protein RvY_05044 [Ramazzottius varieornatus]
MVCSNKPPSFLGCILLNGKRPNTPEWQERHSLKAKCPKLLDRYLQDNHLGKYFVKRPEIKKRMCTELTVRKAITPPARKATKRSTTNPEPGRRRKLSPETHYCRPHSRSPSRSVSPCATPEPEPGQVRYTGRLQLTTGPKFRSVPDPYDSKANLWVRQT